MDSSRFSSDRLDIPQPRRVVTSPISIPASLPRPKSSSSTSSSHAPLPQSEEPIETLYNHPSVRIISFTSTQSGFASSLPVPSDRQVPPGSLPPSSRLERTIAAGALQIYRAPGSVAFLSCGSALQPILPKSQCWCINEDNSRFVLQIRRPQYWRIEVPVNDPDYAHRAVLLRDVFDRILLFERTECPFERSFTVQLPSPLETPKKKAWTADGKNLISSPFESGLSPPADAPMAISRGKRTTSVPRKFSLTGFEPRLIEAREADANGSRIGSGLGTREHSSGQVVSGIEVYEGIGAHGDIDIARYHTIMNGDQEGDHSVRAPDQASAHPPASAEKIFLDATTASIPSSPSTSAGAFRRPEVSTPNSSVGELDAFCEQSYSHSLQIPRLDLTNGQLTVQKGEDDDPTPRALHGFEGHGEDTNVRILRVEDKREVPSHHLPETRESSGEVDNTTTDLLVPVSTETRQGPCASDENDGDILDSGDSNNEDGPASFEGSGRVAPVNLTRKRMTRMLAGRSYTGPLPRAQVASTTIKPNKQVSARRVSPPQPPQSLTEDRSPSASTDSFHSVQSWRSSVTPPTVSQIHDSLHTGDLSSGVKTSSSPESLSPKINPSDHLTTLNNTSNVVSSPPAVSDGCNSMEHAPRSASTVTDENPEAPIDMNSKPTLPQLSATEDKLPIRRRAHASSLSIARHTLSPLPPPADFFSTPPRQAPQSRLAAVRRLPVSLIQKTVDLLLSPPSHLVNLMLKVAAKIVAGEWRGLVFGLSEAGEQIPVEWDYYSDGEFSDLSDGDDYTLAAHSSSYSDSISHSAMRRRTRCRHDEID